VSALNKPPRRRPKKVSISDLYLAFRQAKVAHFYERRGVGLVALAEFEANLRSRRPTSTVSLVCPDTA
jgi:hypothetical protein